MIIAKENVGEIFVCMYTYICTYACCRGKKWSNFLFIFFVFFFGGGGVESKIGPRLRQQLVQDLLCLFSPSFIVFLVFFLNTNTV